MTSHYALQNYDILGEIFQHLAISDVSSQTDRAILASSARVCRAFSEHALNLLWQSLDGLLPALMLLPSFTVSGGHSGMEEDETYILSRLPSTSELQKFNTYAARVKSLSFSTSRAPAAKGNVLLQLVELNDGEPLFPSLRELWWYQWSPIDPSIQAVLTPSLEWVLLSLLHARTLEKLITRDRGDKALSELMRTIRDAAPSIWRLTIYGHLPAVALTPVLTWSRLRFVDVDIHAGADPALMKTLASIPTLFRVSIAVGSLISEEGPLSSGFRTLQECVLMGTSRDIARALDMISSPLLRSVDLDIWELSDTPSQTSDVQRLLGTVPRFAALREFTLSYENSLLHDPTPLVRCLTSMRNLEKVDLNVIQQLDLQEKDLVDIATALPRLKEFTYYAAQGMALHQSIDVLFRFARLCPDLHRLDLPSIDFRFPVDPEPSARRLDPPHTLRHLRVSDRVDFEREDEEARLAEMLNAMFPYLDMGDPLGSYLGDATKWERVLRRLTSAKAQTREPVAHGETQSEAHP